MAYCVKPDNDNIRLMTRADAASYCACNPATFSRWVKAGLVPQSLPGIQRWDRRALDRQFDNLSGLTDKLSEDDEYLTWKRLDDAR
jgi:macrodomain Ter protein organizer (MatP/YcbG family)